MDQNSQEKLRQHFKDAFNWHYIKYISPKRHRAFIAILIAIALIFTWLILKLTLIDINVEKIPFPIYYGDGIKSYPSIKKIPADSRDINKGVAKYLISQYLNTRESYSRKVFEEQNWNQIQKQISGFSSKEVYSQYLQSISTNNQNSPYFLYLRNRARKIQIDEVYINKSNNYAEIAFTAIDEDRDFYEAKYYKAKIGYFVSDAEQVSAGALNFKFLITSYEIVENNA